MTCTVVPKNLAAAQKLLPPARRRAANRFPTVDDRHI
jgi:hypothetical protein